MIEIKTKLMYSKDAVPYNINMKDVLIKDCVDLLRTEGVPLCKLEVYLEGYKNGAVNKGCVRPDVQECLIAKRMLESLSSPSSKVKGRRVCVSLPLTDGIYANPPAQMFSTQDLFLLFTLVKSVSDKKL